MPTDDLEPVSETTGDLFPKTFRTVCYALGTFLGLGVSPALLAIGETTAAAACAPIAGAFLALALGYNPNRNGGS